jgi:hypothetical protein
MGAFIVNYQIRTESVGAVRTVLEKLISARAAISPPQNGWVTVYDEESDSQDDTMIRTIASGISRALKSDVIAFLVHDSDIASYWLYQFGNLLDEFNSAPDYFGGVVDTAARNRVRGNPERLLPLCVPGTTIDQIDCVIHPSEKITFAEDYLTSLAPLLGIDDTRISLCFEYFENEGKDILDDASEFILIEKDSN